jgi:epsilon-lactone hydrolase
MQSVKSRMLNWIMRNRHLLQFKTHKQVFTKETSILEFRKQCERGSVSIESLSTEFIIQREQINGINCEWIKPKNTHTDKLIFYIHGGGYISGSCSDHRRFVSNIARKTGYTCFIYEYRLAPEFPFPAAIDDSVNIYQSILDKGYKPGDILFMGESAGGGLTLALLLALKDKKISYPIAAVAVSPWADLTCSGESYKTKNAKSVAPLNSWNVFSSYYVGNNDPKIPLISPLFGDLSGLPSLFINSGMDDELFDDGYRFYQKAKENNVDIVFKQGEHMVHCYPLLAPLFPEAIVAFNEITDFIKGKLK